MNKGINIILIILTIVWILLLTGCKVITNYMINSTDYSFFDLEDNFVIKKSTIYNSLLDIDNPEVKFSLIKFGDDKIMIDTEYINNIGQNTKILSKDTYIEFCKDNIAIIKNDKIEFKINTKGYRDILKIKDNIFVAKVIGENNTDMLFEVYNKSGNLKSEYKIDLGKREDIYSISQYREGILITGKVNENIVIAMIDYNANLEWIKEVKPAIGHDLGFIRKQYEDLIYIIITEIESQSKDLYIFNQNGKEINKIKFLDTLKDEINYEIINIDEMNEKIIIGIKFFNEETLSKVYIYNTNGKLEKEISIDGNIEDINVIKNKIFYILDGNIENI